MADLWYYTCEGRQMEPVSPAELRTLARDGLLKPTDMVWKSGWPRWVRASSVKEVFADPTNAIDRLLPLGDVPTVPPAPPPQVRQSRTKSDDESKRQARDDDDRRRARRRDPDDDDRPRSRRRRDIDDEEEDDRPRRRARRAPSATNVPVIVGLCLGGGVLLLGLIVLASVLMFAGGGPPARMPAQNNGRISYALALQPMQHDVHSFAFRQGATYVIGVTTTHGFPAPNVNLSIEDGPNQVVMGHAGFGPNPRLFFVPVQSGDYQIKVHNVGNPRSMARSIVTIDEMR